MTWGPLLNFFSAVLFSCLLSDSCLDLNWKLINFVWEEFNISSLSLLASQSPGLSCNSSSLWLAVSTCQRNKMTNDGSVQRVTSLKVCCLSSSIVLPRGFQCHITKRLYNWNEIKTISGAFIMFFMFHCKFIDTGFW